MIKAAVTVTVASWVLLSACNNNPVGYGNDNNDRFSVYLPQSYMRDLDLLVVVDNSDSMLEEQALLLDAHAIMWSLRDVIGGLPNIHIGVTSTDLGSDLYQIATCEEVGGDRGNLIKGNCVYPQGANYIVDVEPSGCEIEKELGFHGELIQCISHDCVQSNCDHEPATTIGENQFGCPRCRNYEGPLADVFGCLMSLGTTGCEFEQPLEAMYQALNDNPQNSGFLRQHAYLGVVFMTDEDDCSVSDPRLFDPAQNSIDSPLGYLSSFRCFEFGVTCDINDRTHVGLRQACEPRVDPGALLHPISRYVQFLGGLKDPGMLAVSASAGPVENQSVTVGLDADERPEVQDSCFAFSGRAVPGIRLKTFIDAFTEDGDMAWAFKSICADSGVAFLGVFDKIVAAMEFSCLPEPIEGCADVGVEFGLPQADQTCVVNGRCLPQCQVTDVFERGTANEQQFDVQHCLEVMLDGTLRPGNTDRVIAYADGRPQERDANLPVPACWYINYHQGCEQSNFAQMIVSRRSDPPPYSFAEVSCAQVLKNEQLCSDGLDNDEDCLVDEEDPDC